MNNKAILLIFLTITNQAIAMNGFYSEPYQVGITLKNQQVCLYLHSQKNIHLANISSNHRKYSQNNQYADVWFSGRLTDKSIKVGNHQDNCLIVPNLSFNIPYNVYIEDEEQPSRQFSHTENFCIRNKDNQIFVSETTKTEDGLNRDCADKPLVVQYRPKSKSQPEPNFLEKIWRWLFD